MCILSGKKARQTEREAYYGRKELKGVGYQRDNTMFENERKRSQDGKNLADEQAHSGQIQTMGKPARLVKRRIA